MRAWVAGGLIGVLLLAGCASNRSADSSPAEPPVPVPVQETSVAADQAEAQAGEGQMPEAVGEASAEQQSEQEQDKLERVNRVVFNFNSTVDRGVLKPVAVGYDRVVPGPVRRRVNNFFHWLREPGNAINNGLQGDVKGLFTSLSRFLINGTVGLAGTV